MSLNRYGVTFLVERENNIFSHEEIVVDAANASDAMSIACVKMASGLKCPASIPKIVDLRAVDPNPLVERADA